MSHTKTDFQFNLVNYLMDYKNTDIFRNVRQHEIVVLIFTFLSMYIKL